MTPDPEAQCPVADHGIAFVEFIGKQIIANPVAGIAVLSLLALLSAFFVAAEAAFHRVHSSQLEDAFDEGRPGAGYALALCRNLGPHLAACQFGSAASNLLSGLIGGVLVVFWLLPVFGAFSFMPSWVPWLTLLVAITLIATLQAILCQQIPRALGYRKAVPTAIACARAVRGFYLVAFVPARVAHLLSSVFVRRVLKLDLAESSHLNNTEDDLRIMVEETGRAHVVTETEREILENALELNELCVRDIITPRNEVIDLDVHRTFKENLQAAIESKHTRFPLVDGHLDQALGLIHLKDLLREMQRDSPNLFAAKRDLLRVSEKLPLDELLKLFLARRVHMALVVDQFGGSLGLVTLDDVLDEVVGEINDEFDEEEAPPFQRLNESSFLVEGWVPLHELADEVEDLELESAEVSTIGGYLTSLFGRLPDPGDQIEVEGYLATVEHADERVVEKIRFEKLEPETDENSDFGLQGTGEATPLTERALID